jgi:hypothetical protein
VLAQFTALAVEDGTGDAMPLFAPVELGQRSSPLGFVVDVGQRVQRPLILKNSATY